MTSLSASTKLFTTHAASWAPYETRFGLGWVGWAMEGHVVALALPGEKSPGPITTASSAVRSLIAGLEAYFAGEGPLPEAAPYVERCAGTSLDIEIRRTVASIRRGETMTYAEVAGAVGRPGAGRAVGSSMARNPIAPIVPCHRVVGSNGDLRGYRGGRAMKRALLEMERADA